MMNTLTQEQAYAAMYAFLEQHFRLTNSDDLCALLGSMSLLPDGKPADPAVAQDWQDAIAKALKSKDVADLKLK